MNLEAAIWHLFASIDFFRAVVLECEDTMEWFGTLAVSRKVSGFGRNNQIFDTFKTLAHDFRIGSELAEYGDYRLIWDTARCVRGDVRGMMEQPLRSWMTHSEYQEFSEIKIGRLMTYARHITNVLNNAMMAADCFFDPDPDCPERANDDDGFPGDEIVKTYNSNINRYKLLPAWALPDPLPEYIVDRAVTCTTGEDVPRTGIWYPETGLERHSLTFAIKGQRMQPAFRIIKTKDELKAEGAYLPSAETVAVATAWHPFLPYARQLELSPDLLAKAGQPCPRAGVWQTQDVNATERPYGLGEPMANLGSAYGLTVWRWHKES